MGMGLFIVMFPVLVQHMVFSCQLHIFPLPPSSPFLFFLSLPFSLSLSLSPFFWRAFQGVCSECSTSNQQFLSHIFLNTPGEKGGLKRG